MIEELKLYDTVLALVYSTSCRWSSGDLIFGQRAQDVDEGSSFNTLVRLCSCLCLLCFVMHSPFD